MVVQNTRIPQGPARDLKFEPHEELRRVEILSPRSVLIEIAYNLHLEPTFRGFCPQRYSVVSVLGSPS